MGDNHNDRNNGWERHETWGRGEQDNNAWGRQIDEDNAAAEEVRNVVAELLAIPVLRGGAARPPSNQQ